MTTTDAKSAARPRGRPRAFDRDEALTKAAYVFWQLGYEGTSIADLTDAMGITPQSLYAAFQSKAELCREALARYCVTEAAFTARALEEEPTIETAFGRLLREAAHEYARTDRPRGCMLSTGIVTSASENEEIASYATGLRAKVLAGFTARIERGRVEGDLNPETDAAALARFLQAVVQGMSLQARDGASEVELLSIATLATAELERHRPEAGTTPQH
jgi:AcrR family transcriptional regulator